MANPRLSAGINNNGGKNVNPLYKAASTLTSYVGNVAREIRDIPTAIGTNSQKEVGRQVKEAAAAITANEKGTSVQHVQANGKMKHKRTR